MSAHAQPEAQNGLEARYRFLLGFLIDKGVLSNKRYSNGTWVLRGVYGVDDSGLNGAGRTAEEAVDNAIIAHRLDPESAERFRQATHAAIASMGHAEEPLGFITHEHADALRRNSRHQYAGALPLNIDVWPGPAGDDVTPIYCNAAKTHPIAAAQELLEALRETYDALCISYPLHSGDMDKRSQIMERARAAIAKATKEQP